MNNAEISRLAKEDLIRAIRNFKTTLDHLGHNNADVEYELYDAILDATDGTINMRQQVLDS